MTTNDDLMRALGRVEGKQDAILERLAVTDARLSDHSKRLNSLEKWRSYVLGVVAVVAGVFGITLKHGS